MSNTLSEINISLTKMMNDLKEIHILPAMPKNFDSLIYKLSDWLLHHNANNFTVLLDTCSGEYAVLDEWTSDELDAGNILAIVISQCSDKLYQKIQNNRDLYNDCVYNIYDKLHSLAVVKRNLSNMEHVKDLLSLISGSEDDSYALTLANVFQVKDSNSLKEDVLTELSKNMIISDSSYRLAYTDSLPEQYSRKLSRRLCLYNFLSLLSDEQYYIVRFSLSSLCGILLTILQHPCKNIFILIFLVFRKCIHTMLRIYVVPHPVLRFVYPTLNIMDALATTWRILLILLNDIMKIHSLMSLNLIHVIIIKSRK